MFEGNISVKIVLIFCYYLKHGGTVFNVPDTTVLIKITQDIKGFINNYTSCVYLQQE